MYASDLIDKFSENENISFWVFGHTHHNVDVTKNSTRYVTNQVGKKWDKCSSNKSIVFDTAASGRRPRSGLKASGSAPQRGSARDRDREAGHSVGQRQAVAERSARRAPVLKK